MHTDYPRMGPHKQWDRDINPMQGPSSYLSLGPTFLGWVLREAIPRGGMGEVGPPEAGPEDSPPRGQESRHGGKGIPSPVILT